MKNTLVLERVRKNYNGYVAVKELDLAVPSGTICIPTKHTIHNGSVSGSQ